MALVDYESECWSSDEEEIETWVNNIGKKEVLVDNDKNVYDFITHDEIGIEWKHLFIPNNKIQKVFKMIGVLESMSVKEIEEKDIKEIAKLIFKLEEIY